MGNWWVKSERRLRQSDSGAVHPLALLPACDEHARRRAQQPPDKDTEPYWRSRDVRRVQTVPPAPSAVLLLCVHRIIGLSLKKSSHHTDTLFHVNLINKYIFQKCSCFQEGAKVHWPCLLFLLPLGGSHQARWDSGEALLEEAWGLAPMIQSQWAFTG